MEINQGMYADKKVAEEWMTWVKSFANDDTREREIYPWLSAWVKKVKPQNILEIGSGTGLCSEKVFLDGVDYVGVEPSQHLREYACKLYPSRKFMGGTAERIPLGDSSMDAVFSVFVWLHISDLDVVAKELYRVLKPNGHFAIVTANPEAYQLWLSWHINTKISGKEVLGDMKRLSNHRMFLHSMYELDNSFSQNNLIIDEIAKCKSKKEPKQDFTLILAGHKGN